MVAANGTAARVLAERPDISSKELAEMFSRTERWARMQKAAASGPEKAPVKPLKSDPSTTPAKSPRVAERRSRPLKAPTADKQTFGARAVVWSGLILGLGFSVAANVSSANGGIGPSLAAGFAPLATLLAIEAMIRPKWFRGGWGIKLARFGGLSVVAVVAAIVSYGHQKHLLLTFGETELSASILPLAADGLIVITATALLAMKPEEKK